MATFDQTLPDTSAGDANDGQEDATGATWNSNIAASYPYGQYFQVAERDTSGDHFNGGVRFENVTIAQGASITSATLTLGIESAANNTGFNITVYGDDVDNAPAWSNSSRPESGFTNTTASTTFEAPTSGTTHDITVTSIVQEIVDRGSWASGNAMRFGLVRDTGATYREIRFEDVDVGTGDTAQRPRLVVVYTTGGSTPKFLTLLGVG